jgi:hypothetical protein
VFLQQNLLQTTYRMFLSISNKTMTGAALITTRKASDAKTGPPVFISEPQGEALAPQRGS